MPDTAQRFSISTAWEGEEVDLLDHVFQVLATTKALAAKVTAAEKKLTEATNEAKLVDAFGAALDLRLKPVGQEAEKPSALLKKGWEDGKIGIEHMTAFYRYITQVATLPPM